MEMYKIREATLEDAERLVEIYSHYVLNTAVSFEYEVPTVTEFRERMRNIMKKYPYLVAAGGMSKRCFAQEGELYKHRVERCPTIKDALTYIERVDEMAEKKIAFFGM